MTTAQGQPATTEDDIENSSIQLFNISDSGVIAEVNGTCIIFDMAMRTDHRVFQLAIGDSGVGVDNAVLNFTIDDFD